MACTGDGEKLAGMAWVAMGDDADCNRRNKSVRKRSIGLKNCYDVVKC